MTAARKKRTSRVVYGTYVAIVAAFTVSSTWQVALVVFGEPVTVAEAARVAKVSESCGKTLNARLRAIDTAQAAASLEPNAKAATAKYAAARASWSATPDGQREQEDSACAADPRGIEAVAALDRLDRAAEAHAVREAKELSPVRLAAQSFISGPR